MKMKRLIVPAALLGCAAVSAENLNYAPASGGTTAKHEKYGYHVYSAENWQTEAGVNKKPVAGDVLVINKNNQMTADPTAQGVRLGGYPVQDACDDEPGADLDPVRRTRHRR